MLNILGYFTSMNIKQHFIELTLLYVIFFCTEIVAAVVATAAFTLYWMPSKSNPTQILDLLSL